MLHASMGKVELAHPMTDEEKMDAEQNEVDGWRKYHPEE